MEDEKVMNSEQYLNASVRSKGSNNDSRYYVNNILLFIFHFLKKLSLDLTLETNESTRKFQTCEQSIPNCWC